MAEDGTAVKTNSYQINGVEQKVQQLYLKSKYQFQKNVQLNVNKAQVFLFMNKSLNKKTTTLKHKKPMESWIPPSLKLEKKH